MELFYIAKIFGDLRQVSISTNYNINEKKKKRNANILFQYSLSNLYIATSEYTRASVDVLFSQPETIIYE